MSARAIYDYIQKTQPAACRDSRLLSDETTQTLKGPQTIQAIRNALEWTLITSRLESFFHSLSLGCVLPTASHQSRSYQSWLEFSAPQTRYIMIWYVMQWVYTKQLFVPSPTHKRRYYNAIYLFNLWMHSFGNLGRMTLRGRGRSERNQ